MTVQELMISMQKELDSLIKEELWEECEDIIRAMGIVRRHLEEFKEENIQYL